MKKITAKQRLEYRDISMWERTRGRVTKEQAEKWAEVLIWDYSYTYKYILKEISTLFTEELLFFRVNTNSYMPLEFNENKTL